MSLFARMQEQNKKDDAAPVAPAINPPESAQVDDTQANAAKQAAYEAENARLAAKEAEVAAEKAAKKEAAAAKKAAKPAPTSVPATAPTGLTLYLDCFPVSKPPVEMHWFEDLAAKARTRISEVNNLADYRFAEYGQGPGIFQQTVAQLLDEGILKVQHLVVDTRVPEAQACLALLKSRATSIVMSTR